MSLNHKSKYNHASGCNSCLSQCQHSICLVFSCLHHCQVNIYKPIQILWLSRRKVEIWYTLKADGLWQNENQRVHFTTLATINGDLHCHFCFLQLLSLVVMMVLPGCLCTALTGELDGIKMKIRVHFTTLATINGDLHCHFCFLQLLSLVVMMVLPGCLCTALTGELDGIAGGTDFYHSKFWSHSLLIDFELVILLRILIELVFIQPQFLQLDYVKSVKEPTSYWV